MITQQTSKQSHWEDETGAVVPFNRLTASEKLREKMAARLLKGAQKLNADLAAFKALFADTHAEIVEAIQAENKIKPDSKGNFTWFNFNRTIKVEASIDQLIKFDDVLIDGAKKKLLNLISENVKADDFIKNIITDAFQTSSGRLDTKRVLGLKKHTDRISNPQIREEWAAAMDLIDKSISRPSTKTYYRISLLDDNGEFQAIDLNFSSVKP